MFLSSAPILSIRLNRLGVFSWPSLYEFQDPSASIAFLIWYQALHNASHNRKLARHQSSSPFRPPCFQNLRQQICVAARHYPSHIDHGEFWQLPPATLMDVFSGSVVRHRQAHRKYPHLSVVWFLCAERRNHSKSLL